MLIRYQYPYPLIRLFVYSCQHDGSRRQPEENEPVTSANIPAVDFRDKLIRYGSDFYPEIVEKAQGCYVWDAAGKKILDFTSGQMCATVGHSHPNVVAAIKKSCDTALHLFSGMIPRSVVELSNAIAKIVPRPLRKSLFLNTGS